MQTTGQLISILHYLVALFPVLPVIFILSTQLFKNPVLNVLMIICLLHFIVNTLLYFTSTVVNYSIALVNITRLIEVLLFLLLLRRVSKIQLIKNITGILMVSAASVLLTYYFNTSFLQENNIVNISCAIIVVLTMFSLLNIALRNDPIYIFKSSLFWLTSGTLLYYTAGEVLNLGSTYFFYLSKEKEIEKTVFLLSLTILRFLFYTIATVAGMFSKK